MTGKYKGVCPACGREFGMPLNLRVDENIKQAIDMWIEHGMSPGSCTTLLLKGDYEEAFKHAHPLIKPHWDDHIKYVESLPSDCRGENMSEWKGLRNDL